MKIFITGATGFIGSYVLKQCLVSDHSVVALRRPKHSSSIPIKQSDRLQWLRKPMSDVEPNDLSDIHAIIHLAATGVSPRVASWNELSDVNINAALNMCNIAFQLEVPIVIAGSYAEYGLSALDYSAIPVTAPLRPTFPYAVSKATAYQLVSGFARTEGLAVGYLRIFNAYGDGQHHANLWPSLREAALSGGDFDLTLGEQVRDFIHVSDVAQAFLDSLDCSVLKPGCTFVKNIGSGIPTSVSSFCRHWWTEFQASGRLRIGSLPYRSNEIMRYVPSLNGEYL